MGAGVVLAGLAAAAGVEDSVVGAVAVAGEAVVPVAGLAAPSAGNAPLPLLGVAGEAASEVGGVAKKLNAGKADCTRKQQGGQT
jgi:predicted phage tail protein